MVDFLMDADHIKVGVRAAAPSKAFNLTTTAPVRTVVVHGSSGASDKTSAHGSEPHRGRILGEVASAGGISPTGAGKGDGGKSGEGKSEKLRTPGEGTVNINTADADELQRLPGVGPAMSGRILDYRKQIGRFASPEQLRDVKGIGEKTYAKMESFVRVN